MAERVWFCQMYEFLGFRARGCLVTEEKRCAYKTCSVNQGFAVMDQVKLLDVLLA